MILNRNYYDMVSKVDQVPAFIGSEDTLLLYLPLAHNFGRCLHLLGAYVGFTIAFCPDPLRVGEVAPAVRPTVLPSVPRVYEKVHTAVLASFDEATGVKRKLIDWALDVGKRVSKLRQEGRPVPRGLAAQHMLADKLVYSKVKKRLGGRLRFGISGGAAGQGDRGVLPRARHPDPRGLRHDGGHDGLEREHARALPLRDGRPRPSRDRATPRRRR